MTKIVVVLIIAVMLVGCASSDTVDEYCSDGYQVLKTYQAQTTTMYNPALKMFMPTTRYIPQYSFILDEDGSKIPCE